MKRRDFIAALGPALGWWQLAAGQQPAVPTIGYLSASSALGNEPNLAAFRRGLAEGGYIEGRDVAIEYRWADGDFDRLPGLAADLVSRRVDVVVATGATSAGVVAKRVAANIPVVFLAGVDPVQAGLVQSLSRPGGNATGVSNLTVELFAKRLQLLRDLVPGASTVAVLINPRNPDAAGVARAVEEAAREFGLRTQTLRTLSEGEIDEAFARAAEQRVDGLVLGGDTFFNTARARVLAAAARHRIRVIYPRREFVLAGGLMSYAPDLTDMHRQVAVYAARILRGANPAELPVTQPTKFELAINLKTAKTLGIEIPLVLLARADEVIE